MNSRHSPEVVDSVDGATCDVEPHALAELQSWWQRDVVNLLGIPFDAVTMAQTLAAVRQAVLHRRRLFLSTPNVNFAMAARHDPTFRESVLCSDLVVADGMPLVWLARLQGLPITERVAGADLFERLLHEDGPPIRIYFFGGPPGAAAAASQRINQRAGALRCVGWQSPGFGSLEELSGQQYLDPINHSGADFVVVALGASKGQAWIMRNRTKLDAPVLSHLGAVVNFMARTVRRAPTWMQRTGLEWIWRIAQEPRLWRRYWNDGRMLATELSSSVVTSIADKFKCRSQRTGGIQASQLNEYADGWQLTISCGASSLDRLNAMRCAFETSENGGQAISINVPSCAMLGPSELALLQLAQARLPQLTLHADSPSTRSKLAKIGINALASLKLS